MATEQRLDDELNQPAFEQPEENEPAEDELKDLIKKKLPVIGQPIAIEPADVGSGYETTVLHSSPTMHVLVDLPPLGMPVTLQTPRQSRVFAKFRSRDGSLVTWAATVLSFGNWGVGLHFESPVTEGAEETEGNAGVPEVAGTRDHP